MTSVTAPPRSYADAPRLPDATLAVPVPVNLRSIVHGEWLEVELGPGRGGFLIERAAAEPRAALVGLEIRRKWAAIVDARLAKLGHAARARVFAEDARFALPRIVPDASVRRFFSHFPDPWWKKRHQKRLMLSTGLVAEVARLLEPSGEIFMQTDVEERAAQFEAALAADERFASWGDTPGSPRLAANPYLARSPRERRAMADGLPIFRVRFTRR